MRVFIDTNVTIDLLMKRQPHFTDCQAVMDRCDARKFDLFIAWHGLATAYYIVGNAVGDVLAAVAVREFLNLAAVATTGDAEARQAFTLGFKDLEDAMQAVAAEACNADVIVTRNKTDFAGSPVPAFTPAEFLARFP